MGKKYNIEFDSFKGKEHKVSIYEKGYAGTVINIVGAAEPVVMKWEGEDSFTPVRGLSADIKLLVEADNIQISDFYNEDSTYYQVDIETDNEIVFTGYLVQDDCREEVIDWVHTIVLVATDNLGLLRDIPFDQANKLYGPKEILIADVEITLPRQIRYVGNVFSSANVGDTIIVNNSGNSGLDGIAYTIVNFEFFGGGFDYFVDEDLAIAINYSNVEFTFIDTKDLTVRQTIADLLLICLRATNLNLKTNVFSKLYEVISTDPPRFIEQIALYPKTFKDNDIYQSCYDVLTDILERFRATLFQSKGLWNIVRFGELRAWDATAVDGFRYDANMIYEADITAPTDTILIPGTDFETGLEQSIQRAWKFTEETFNYQRPDSLLNNGNLEKLGAFISGGTDGIYTYKDYKAPDYQPGFAYNNFGTAVGYNYTSIAKIRVYYDVFLNEFQRTLLVQGPVAYDFATAIGTNPIEINQQDKITLSFDVRGRFSRGGPSFVTFSLFSTPQIDQTLTPRSLEYRLAIDEGKWIAHPFIPVVTQAPTFTPFQLFIDRGDNINEWHSVSIECDPAPFDSILYVNFAQLRANETTEYRNINLDVKFNVTGTSNLKGHIHTTEQIGLKKDNQKLTLKVDDAPRSQIDGAMFISTVANARRQLSRYWNNTGLTGFRRLGQITTLEDLFIRYKTRIKLEGNLLTNNNNYLLSKIKIDIYPNLYFIFGRMEVDLKNDRVQMTLLEIWSDGELIEDVVSKYNFKNIYDSPR